MRNKRMLLFVLLALAVVTSLTAGTLAVYTSSVDITADVATKAFTLTTTGSESWSPEIKLAPADIRDNNRGTDLKFTVRNYDDNGVVSEVPIKVDFDLTAGGQLFSVNGLDVKIVDFTSYRSDAEATGSGKGKKSWMYGYSNKSGGALQKVYGPGDSKCSWGGYRNNKKALILPAGEKVEYELAIRLQWIDFGNGANQKLNAEHTEAGENQYTGSIKLSVSGTQVTDNK